MLLVRVTVDAAPTPAHSAEPGLQGAAWQEGQLALLNSNARVLGWLWLDYNHRGLTEADVVALG